MLRKGTQVTIELLIPIGEFAQLSELLHLIDIVRAQAATIGFLDGDQVKIIEHKADALQILKAFLVWQYVFPAAGNIMPISAGTDANLNIKA